MRSQHPAEFINLIKYIKPNKLLTNNSTPLLLLQNVLKYKYESKNIKKAKET